MGNAPRLRDSVIRCKAKLAEGREKLRRQHQTGSRGIQVCNRLADLVDGVIVCLFEAAVDNVAATTGSDLRSQVALVPVGGYGRQDVAPFSDVDLLLLHHPAVSTRISDLAGRLLADVSDLGLKLGFSVRTPGQACQLAHRDAVIFTSQTEARFLVGSETLFERFMHRFRRQARKGSRTYIQCIEQARRAERNQFGDTVSMLEPNLKRSLGGLRDIHLLRWVGFARYGESNPANLRLQGFLGADDERFVRRALEFLLRLRNELHFHANRPYDVLYRAEQVRIAELWNYRGSENVLPVERFMQDYFEHTSGIRDVVGHFCASARHRSAVLTVLSPLVTHRMDRDFRIGPYHIGTTQRGRKRLQGNLTEVLRLMDLANQADKWIEHKTWQAVRDATLGRPHLQLTPEAVQRFLSLLSYTARLGNLLRRLHEVGVLEKLVVGLGHARCLLQFNQYHKYTVDEHCILAVEKATQFLLDPGPLGTAYRSVQDRAMLHLALLVHDLGKGLPGDHSEVGAELAGQTGLRLRLSRRRIQMLQFLVRNHLMMAHLAFRRDTSNEQVLIQFATEVGSPEFMKMLYIFTAADLAAVGPGTLNPWKIEILTDVYLRAMYHLKGGDSDSESVIIRMERKRYELQQMAPADDRTWFERQIQKLNNAFLLENEPEAIVEDLRRLHGLESHRVAAWGRYLPDRQVTEYVVGLQEELTPGIFHRVTGALTSQGLKILSASIHTLAEGLVLDRFTVEDPDHAGPPPDGRLQAVNEALVSAIENPSDQPPAFRRVWTPTHGSITNHPQVLPTRVVIDNSTLPDRTIVDVFAHDQVGLLYAITRTLYRLGLSVSYAKIGTHLDQVVDVFYVTDQAGGKIEDELRWEYIHDQLLRAIE